MTYYLSDLISVTFFFYENFQYFSTFCLHKPEVTAKNGRIRRQSDTCTDFFQIF